MNPDLEIVPTHRDESFRAWIHDYPHSVAKWHFHPEYEIHLIQSSHGKMFVGDHIGDFGPGNLIITGPNLPHNWVSELPDGERVPSRDVVLQFSRDAIEKMVGAFSELQPVIDLIDDAARGVQFPDRVGRDVAPLMLELANAHGCRRVEILMSLFDRLSSCRERRVLAGPGYRSDAQHYMSSTINQVLSYLQQNLPGMLRETDVAAFAGMSVSTFTRFFRRHTGSSFVRYLNRLRINEACELLMFSDLTVTDICYRVGFNNLSNFNRQFLAMKQVPPSRFRALHRLNEPHGRDDAPPLRRAPPRAPDRMLHT
ncbi:AraC family transcriptional regulator [Burkholderia contaminans]|jgi:AraC-like DNA-binding protein|uniref:AraC family transcriptional regulator n=1 Tax=Burkholderia contaminans TaxID=488447 RepID=A0AAP4R2G8_9BURK|nr:MULTISPECIES: AraC family transcriptional regulator [Burkholderia]AKM43077.1 AraC family transcriptional regulator [Burkholderia contaminans]MBD1411826.1 AraC family transcriptional regulator [Burkholderia contaminans]MBH9671091.1 AraC family transcriptional regulator [Burkholderia contaminans]MBH9677975.1 AraC family transcriptional regulator [Burkholderia contaminans]MBH9708399.1 AraC family transcriptional regulator [Burkholderia contaminans]